MFKDWASARQGCGAGNRRSEVFSRSREREEYKNILAEEFNVAWEVIKRNNYLFSDRELAELCMTISGTIIAYKEGDSRKVVTYPSKADNDNLIKSLFEGGNVKTYGCSDAGKCLKVQLKNYSVASGGFKNKVQRSLSEISRKTITDEPLSPKEIEFINKVQLPIYKMINVLNTYKRKEFDITNFTDIISIDLIHQYITEIIDVMLEEVANLRNAQVSDEETNEFIRQLRRAKASINEKRNIAYKQINQVLILIETGRIYEKKLENAFDVLQNAR